MHGLEEEGSEYGGRRALAMWRARSVLRWRLTTGVASAAVVWWFLCARPLGEVLLHVIQAQIEVSAGNNEVVPPVNDHVSLLVVQLRLPPPRLLERHLKLGKGSSQPLLP